MKWIMIMMFSPVSPYFAGWNIEAKDSLEVCRRDAAASIGRQLSDVVQMRIGWETQMQGPMPKVIAAYCAQGALAE